MKRFLGSIGYTLYVILFLTVVTLGLVAVTPYFIISVLREKYRAMKQGKPVNWHIFKEGL